MKEQFSFTGRVIEGHHLGHTLGFPTAVTNLGVRPTVEEAGALWVESYLLDFSGDLYGQELTVTLCHFLRPERRFPDVEALRQAIAQNAREARALLLGEGKEDHTPCDQ